MALTFVLVSCINNFLRIRYYFGFGNRRVILTTSLTYITIAVKITYVVQNQTPIDHTTNTETTTADTTLTLT